MNFTSSAVAIRPRQAAQYIALLLLLVAALCVGVILLPHDPYIRYQQFAASDVSRLRWIYERIHFDETPIDAAIIGSSRVEAAVSAPLLEQALSKRLGRPVHVANLAVPLEGRNLHYEIAQELLTSHAETRLIILSLVEPIRRSHPTFRSVANIRNVLQSPFILNYYWLEDISFLPFRQLSLFIQTKFDKVFNVRLEFEQASYRGTNFDTTRSFRLDNGKYVDREALYPLASLNREADRNRIGSASLLSRITGWNENIIEDFYTEALSHQLSSRCAKLVLLNLPTWRGSNANLDLAKNERLAPILLTPSVIGQNWWEYSDAGHLRRTGIDQVTKWLPDALEPHLEFLKTAKQCTN